MANRGLALTGTGGAPLEPECIPLLTCHLHQGLIAHGEHLTHRCSGWPEDLHRQRGWAPVVA